MYKLFQLKHLCLYPWYFNNQMIDQDVDDETNTIYTQ